MAEFKGRRGSEEHKAWLRRQAVQEAKTLRAAERERKYQEDYLAFLDDKAKKENQSFKNWLRAQKAKEKALKTAEKEEYLNKSIKGITAQLNKQLEGRSKIQKILNKDFATALETEKGTIEALKKQYQIEDISREVFDEKLDLIKEITSGELTSAELEELQAEKAGEMNEMEETMLATRIEITKVQEKHNKMLEVADMFLKGNIGKAKDFVKELATDPFVQISAGLIFLGSKLFEWAKRYSEDIDSVGDKFGAINRKTMDSLIDQGIAVQGIGMDLSDVLFTADRLSDKFGVGVQEAVKMSAAIIDSSKAMGLAEEQGEELFGILIGIRGLSQEVAEEIAEGAYNLAWQNDVAPVAVMEDIAGSSGVIAKFGKDNLDNLIRAAVQAKKYGISLSDVAGIAESLLDFSSSIESEMEASILLGKQLNFQRARELALTGDIDEMMEAITDQLGDQHDWDKLNVLQKKSIATSIGVGVEEMSRMFSEQERLISGQKNYKELVGKDTLGAFSKISYKIQEIGARITKSLGKPIENLVNTVYDWIEGGAGLKAVEDIFQSIAGFVTHALTSLQEWITNGDGLTSIFKNIVGFFKGIFKYATMLIPIMIGLKVAAAAMAISESAIAIAKMTGATAFLGGAGGLVAAGVIAGGVAMVANSLIGAAQGADFYTRGPQLMLVGDNPGGVEHVQVNPISSNTVGAAPIGAGTSDMSLKDMKNEMAGLRKDMRDYFGFGGTAIQGIGKAANKESII